MLDWSSREIIGYLDGRQNPLYADGFDRVGCFPCQAAGDVHKERAYQYDDFGREQFIKIKQLSEEIKKPMFTSKGGCQRNNENQIPMFDSSGCAICDI